VQNSDQGISADDVLIDQLQRRVRELEARPKTSQELVIDQLRAEVASLRIRLEVEITPLIREAEKVERLKWLADLGGTALKEYGDLPALSAYGRANAFAAGAGARERARLNTEVIQLRETADRSEYHCKVAERIAREAQAERDALRAELEARRPPAGHPDCIHCEGWGCSSCLRAGGTP